jgi:hypothetical protein
VFYFKNNLPNINTNVLENRFEGERVDKAIIFEDVKASE